MKRKGGQCTGRSAIPGRTHRWGCALPVKKYLVITDSERRPIASEYGGGLEVAIPAGRTVHAWAKFPAPPGDVKTISVYIAEVPPFEDVPIS